VARAFRLQVLLEVYQHRLDAATQDLQRLRNQWNEAQGKLDQLDAYRTEYSARLQAKLAEGLASHQLRDYRVFLDKISRAMEAQSEEVKRRRLAWEAEHARWLRLRQRQQALVVLAERHRIAEAAREARREQKEQDEFALRGADKPVSSG
jgi:flagellar FliJ protein